MQVKKTESEFYFFNNIKQLVEIKDQVILGFYILDFVIPAKLLVIEIDGSSHKGREEYDEKRSDFIRKCGLKIVRYKNEYVINNIQKIIKEIIQYPNILDSLRLFRRALGKANAYRSIAIQKYT